MILLYLLLQLSVCLGYACDGILHLVWNRLSRKSSCKQLKTVSQSLFAVSLLIPLLAPIHVLSPSLFPQAVRTPLSESAQSLAHPITHSPNPYQEKKMESSQATSLFSLPSLNYFHLLSSTALIGFLLGCFGLFKNLLRLNVILKESHLFKKHHNLMLTVSERISVPFSVWYFGKRWIVFPQDLLKNPSQFKISLSHELEHHRESDTVWAFFFELIAPFLYLNPAFFLWKNALLELQEFSCDESLIGRKKMNPRKYGDCLVSIAETALRHRLALKGVVGMANHRQSNTSLERRIRMLASHRNSRPKSLRIEFLGILSFFAVISSIISIKTLAAHSSTEPTPGVASVEPHVQAIAEKYLVDAFQKYRATAGFALVSEAQTGRLLAVANINSEPSAPHSPHWALSLRMEPASLMKAVIAAAAIESGVTEPKEVHNCENGKLIVGDKEYGDWKPFNKLTTAETVALSSNVCGIKIGRKLGIKKLEEALKSFGFSDPALTSHFPEARAGVLPKIEELGDDHSIARLSSGFSLYTTPLEIVQVFGAIANGGNLFEPSQFQEKKKNTNHPLRRIMSEETAKKMREILSLVMTQGTASLSQGKKFILAGKTGTAYSPWLVGAETSSKESQIAHFVGFGPLESPKYVVYVGIQDPKNEKNHRAHGSSHAAPVFRDLIEALLGEKAG